MRHNLSRHPGRADTPLPRVAGPLCPLWTYSEILLRRTEIISVHCDPWAEIDTRGRILMTPGGGRPDHLPGPDRQPRGRRAKDPRPRPSITHNAQLTTPRAPQGPHEPESARLSHLRRTPTPASTHQPEPGSSTVESPPPAKTAQRQGKRPCEAPRRALRKCESGRCAPAHRACPFSDLARTSGRRRANIPAPRKTDSPTRHFPTEMSTAHKGAPHKPVAMCRCGFLIAEAHTRRRSNLGVAHNALRTLCPRLRRGDESARRT